MEVTTKKPKNSWDEAVPAVLYRPPRYAGGRLYLTARAIRKLIRLEPLTTQEGSQ